MSVWTTVSSVLANRCLKIGNRRVPGNPRNTRRSCSWSKPASRFDSPSRSRSTVATRRNPNCGARTPPPKSRSAPRVLFSTVRSKMISPS